MTADRWSVPPGLRRKMVEAARQLRRQQTRAEDVLWAALRNRQIDGLKFRRQQPIGPFVVDFFAPSARLVVEVDGTVHDDPMQRRADQERQRLLESLGLQVLRVRSEEVEGDLAGVLAAIQEAVLTPGPSQALTPDPSPTLGEGRALGEGEIGKGETGRGKRGEGPPLSASRRTTAREGTPLSPCGRGAGGEGNSQ